jgi:hypothetical protein
MRSRRLASFVIPAALVTTVVAWAIPVQAATKLAVTGNGTCSLGSRSNLQVQREDNGKLSIDFGVDMVTHVAGVKWTYRVTDNRSAVMKGTSSTVTDGSFSVTRAITPRTGPNHIVATAKNSATGETCRIRIIG